MALELYIPPCIRTPAGRQHPPRIESPLRVQIDGPLESIQKLFPSAAWNTSLFSPRPYPQEAGPALAALAFRHIFGTDVRPDVPGDMVVRDEYLGWIKVEEKVLEEIDHYGVTFDHLVPADDVDPDVLQINIIEIENDDGEYANTHMPFSVNASDYIGKKVLAVPRCCQKRKGTTDRRRVNEGVLERDSEPSSG
ncbi:hypothetical protein CTA2_2119 [Colletotrichum tanaceti]|uniref:Uncharacterized protein n=1 Tax=Colletotrichum tanaceti TaxID=1306861 RepID=A0A4V6DH59_9PEZI|nr:hypothetical protein CTA2_2120 [Colletotrichum tanaceti]KAJ0163921.1 hypothetical protein CTA2_2119 [Colletotrichum tanaceti]TKW53936.1 hypothetical protein CTA1_2836 [Colletotrichum tanaceti]